MSETKQVSFHQMKDNYSFSANPVCFLQNKQDYSRSFNHNKNRAEIVKDVPTFVLVRDGSCVRDVQFVSVQSYVRQPVCSVSSLVHKT